MTNEHTRDCRGRLSRRPTGRTIQVSWGRDVGFEAPVFRKHSVMDTFLVAACRNLNGKKVRLQGGLIRAFVFEKGKEERLRRDRRTLPMWKCFSIRSML